VRNLWILLLFAPYYGYCQNVTGKIMDGLSQNGVEFATVYVSGTTIGTISDRNGDFSLQLQGIILPCQLVISHVSYRSQVLQISGEKDFQLSITVFPKVVEIAQVDIVQKGFRKDNIRHFVSVFLGNDVWGRSAILKNDSMLIFNVEYFDENDEDQRLKGELKSFSVKSLAPLDINLPKLGYDLQLDLISFTENYNPDTRGYLISSLGTYYFKPKPLHPGLVANRIKRNRLEAYYYSPMHFTRALYDKKLHENGYDVNEVVLLPGKEEVRTVDLNPDSCMVFNADTAVITGLKDHCFRIYYYSTTGGFPVNRDVERFDVVKRSSISFLHDSCVIRKDGTRSRESIVFGPGIGDKRIGAMLPSDYKPDIEK
jgi:hypothetical protein